MRWLSKILSFLSIAFAAIVSFFSSQSSSKYKSNIKEVIKEKEKVVEIIKKEEEILKSKKHEVDYKINEIDENLKKLIEERKKIKNFDSSFDEAVSNLKKIGKGK